MEDEAMLVLQRRQSSGDRGDSQRTATNGQLIAYPPGVLRMRLAGINPNARVSGLNALPGKSNYFIGSDPAMWRTNITNYSEVSYSDLYAGIDIEYYRHNGQLEHEPLVV